MIKELTKLVTAQSKARLWRNLRKGEPSIVAVPSPTAGVGQASQPDLLPRPGSSSCLYKRARSRLRGLDLTCQVALVPHSPCLSWSIVPGLTGTKAGKSLLVISQPGLFEAHQQEEATKKVDRPYGGP